MQMMMSQRMERRVVTLGAVTYNNMRMGGGGGGRGRSMHDLSVQTMQGENWRERWATEREVAGGTYQGDDGGSGPGARHDVQVVGQVELEKRPAAPVDCHVELQSQGCSHSWTWKSDLSDVCFSVN